MPLNPVSFAAQVNRDFISYQLSAFPLADEELRAQMREQLEGHGLAGCPLFKGPYVSLERAFRMGSHLEDLVREGIVHAALSGIAPYPQLFAHQEKALRAALEGRHVLITTGTGSGKTEAFFYPIINRCLELRDAGAEPGIVAVVMYPMNALAMDQLERLREMLAGSGITFGMYTGRTRRSDAEASLVRMGEGERWGEVDKYREKHGAGAVVVPWEERYSEWGMRKEPPRILLTNPYQLEYLLTRRQDLGMFVGAPLEYIVVDEAHRYGGALGAEVACLIRRLRAVADKGPDEVICMGTSATVAGEDSIPQARRFMHRFFGVCPERVEIVQEEYIEYEWPEEAYLPSEEPPAAVELLERIVGALGEAEEDGGGEELLRAAQELTGREVGAEGPWAERLYELLTSSRYVRELTEVFGRPKELAEGVQQLQQRIGRRTYDAGAREKREQCEAEALCYFALGAAARKGDNILLRPKLHYFVSGINGAVAVFAPGEERPRIFLNEEEARKVGDFQPTAVFPVLVCKTCGQHYFEGRYRDWECDGVRIEGGTAEDDNVVWEAVEDGTGQRAVFTDRLVSGEESEEESPTGSTRRGVLEMWICRYCGALHRRDGGDCHAPKCRRREALVRVWVVLGREGRVQKCPGCGQREGSYGGRVYEPLKPVRAVEVADVHVLAQNMMNAMPDERQRKLLIFADNRQEAAFQAGWIRDHARRYRLRHLFYRELTSSTGPASVGDLVEAVARQLEADQELSRALVPEVWEQAEEESFGYRHRQELRLFLRLTLLRELATSFKQRQGLENWGLLGVVYDGIETGQAIVQRWAEKFELEPEEVAKGVCSLLDVWRRNRYLFDEPTYVFSRSWREGDREVMAGYIPYFGVPPKGLLLEVPGSERNPYAAPVVSVRGETGSVQLARKWGLSAERAHEFLEEIWAWLVNEAGLLVGVDFRDNAGHELRGGSGIYQINVRRVGLVAQEERFVCRRCMRIHSRATPRMTCTGWRCGGELRREAAPEDDYDVQLLRRDFVMLRAQEHSAQVPSEHRERYEEEFKKEPPGAVNCLVCTPTLELGVDIGALDMILMRNVPPTAANYWQRVGRSGRRHRMAVNYTYCRGSSHDRYFFSRPLELLDGRVEPPQFNLDNAVLVAKHVRAAVLTELLKQLDAGQAKEAEDLWKSAFPTFIKDYLFEEREGRSLFRERPPDVKQPLAELLRSFGGDLVVRLQKSFTQYWPGEAARQVSPEQLGDIVTNMPEGLQKVVARLHRHMHWARSTRERLAQLEGQGLLEPAEKLLLLRCRSFLEGLNEEDERNYVLRVLSVEGFLPGYGMYEGGRIGFAHRDRRMGASFEISRPDAIAVREFVPGNLLYANNGRFRLARYWLPAREEEELTETFLVSLSRGVAWSMEEATRLPAQRPADAVELKAAPISDCDLVCVSRISDEEAYRFQLPVKMLGMLLANHKGGVIYQWGELEIRHLRGQGVCLLNAGCADPDIREALGYPICTVCGAVRSPYATDTELGKFQNAHRKSCKREPEWLGLYAKVEVDGLLITGFEGPLDGINLAEALRIGGESILEMDREDLQVLSVVVGEREAVFLYDPMPGGSGLLTELLQRWGEATRAAERVLCDCPNGCEQSCYSCMRTFYNSQWHHVLNRRKAVELLGGCAAAPIGVGTIDPVVPSVSEGEPTNVAEREFLDVLRERGFPLPDSQVPIAIPGLGEAIPDFAYRSPPAPCPIAIYLDGLSAQLHGAPERQQRDAFLRACVEHQGWKVLSIPASALRDPQQLQLWLDLLRELLNIPPEASEPT